MTYNISLVFMYYFKQDYLKIQQYVNFIYCQTDFTTFCDPLLFFPKVQ